MADLYIFMLGAIVIIRSLIWFNRYVSISVHVFTYLFRSI